MRYFIFLLICFSISACTPQFNCDQSQTPVPPNGYTITRIGQIEDADFFQMTDASVGFALKTELNERNLYKTENGGQDWAILEFPFDFSLTDMLFVDQETGYIAHRGDGSSAFLLKTSDGGLTWTNIQIETIPDFYAGLVLDDDGILYARTANFSDNGPYIVKFADSSNAEVIFTGSFSTITLLRENKGKLYFKENSEFLRTIDNTGTIISSSQVAGNEDLIVADSDNLLLLDQYRVRKSNDGGNTWSLIFEGAARAIDFSEEDGLMLLVDKAYCGDNPNALSAFASAPLTGSDLEESAEMYNFDYLSFIKAQKIGAGHYLLQRFNEIYELKKM